MQPITKKSGIKLVDIILVKAYCERFFTKSSYDGELEGEKIAFETSYNTSGDKILDVYLTVKLEVCNEASKKLFFIETKVLGIFEADSSLQEYLKSLNISMDEFAKVNASAILYSYVRQNITDLSLQSRIGPIILPVVNFIEMYRENKK